MKRNKYLFTSIIAASLSAAVITPIACRIVGKNSIPNISIEDQLKQMVKSETNIKDINIPSDLKEISARQFMNSDNSSVTWDGGIGSSQLEKIGNSGFAYCKNLTGISLPKKVNYIDTMAFYNCEKLQYIDFSLMQDNMLERNFTLGSHVFKGIGTNIVRENDTELGFIFKDIGTKSNAQYNLELSYIKAMLKFADGKSDWKTKYRNADNDLVEFGEYTAIPIQLMNFDNDGNFNGFVDVSKIIENNGNYDTIIFPKWYTGITAQGYKDLDAIKSSGIIKTVGFISNPNANAGITIESKLFRNWTTIENIILPSNVDSIGDNAFCLTTSLKSINMSEMTAETLPSGLFENSGTKSGCLDILFPKGMKKIEQDVFAGAAISDLSIPEGVTTIKENAFNNCSSLREVTIPKTVTTIGDRAFSGCDSLTTINFTYGNDGQLTNIGTEAFAGSSSLSTLKLPASLFKNAGSTIGARAFATSNSNSVTTIDLSDVSKANLDNLSFGEGCFSGWQSRGFVVGQGDWDDNDYKKILTKLRAAGLGENWGKQFSTAEKNVLVAQYDAGTKLQISPGDFGKCEKIPHIQYSYDLTNWVTLSKNDKVELKDVAPHKVYLRGINNDSQHPGFTRKSEGVGYEQIGILCFTNDDKTKGVEIGGNVMGLIDGGAGTTTTIPNEHCFDKLFFESTALKKVSEDFLNINECTANCYQAMFYGCTNLTESPKLPATKLAKECYYNMFSGCTSLTKTPDLEATTMAVGCYKNMFNGCTNLAKATDFPNVVLANNCFESMYANCKSLTIAPVMPKTDDKSDPKVSTLKEGCYKYMFNGCESLTTAPNLPAIKIPKEAYMGMFQGCKALETAPRIYAPAIKEDGEYTSDTWGVDCYRDMFKNCTSLNKMEVDFIKWPKNPLNTGPRTTLGWASGLTPGGTFVCPYKLPHAKDVDFNVDQIPIGWKVEEKDKPREDDYETPMFVTCKKTTNMSLITGASAADRPDLYVVKEDADGNRSAPDHITASWTKKGSYDPCLDYGNITLYETKKIQFKAGEKLIFFGKNNSWTKITTIKNGIYPTAYTSFMFTNPDGTTNSTGVSLWGSCMSIVLKDFNPAAAKPWETAVFRKESDFTMPHFCFYGLFAGMDSGTEISGDSTMASYAKKGLYNYCLEDFKTADTFFKVPKVGIGTFARTFSHCYNLKQCSSVTSVEGTIRAWTFFDTFCCCKSLINGPEKFDFRSFEQVSGWAEEDKRLPNRNNNCRAAMQGTFVNCTKMETAPELCFDKWWMEGADPQGKISSTGTNTFYRIFDGCKSLQSLKLNFDPSQTTSATKDSLVKNFKYWFLLYCRNVGSYYTDGTRKDFVYKGKPWLKPSKGGDTIALTLYITPGFYNFLVTNFKSYPYFNSDNTLNTGNLPINKTYKWRIYNINPKDGEKVWLNEKDFPK